MSDTLIGEVTVKATRLNELRYFLPFWTEAYVNGVVKKVQVPGGFYQVRLKSSNGIYYVQTISGYSTQYEGQLFPVLGAVDGSIRKRPGIPMPWNLNGWTFWVFIVVIIYYSAKRKKKK